MRLDRLGMAALLRGASKKRRPCHCRPLQPKQTDSSFTIFLALRLVASLHASADPGLGRVVGSCVGFLALLLASFASFASRTYLPRPLLTDQHPAGKHNGFAEPKMQ